MTKQWNTWRDQRRLTAIDWCLKQAYAEDECKEDSNGDTKVDELHVWALSGMHECLRNVTGCEHCEVSIRLVMLLSGYY